MVRSLAVAFVWPMVLSCADSAPAAAQPAATSTSADSRYVDFPDRIDPRHRNRHVRMATGSRLFGIEAVRVVDIVSDERGGSIERSFLTDRRSSFVRTSDGVLVTEPDGSTIRLSPNARIDTSVESWIYVVIPRGRAIPSHLSGRKPDLEVL